MTEVRYCITKLGEEERERTEIWSKLWSEPVKELKRAIARMSNWKAAGPDHVQGFWFKKATSLHPKLKQHLQELVNTGQVPTWLTDECTVPMKDKSKGTCRKLQTNSLPPTDVETVDQYILRSNVWTFELPRIIAK